MFPYAHIPGTFPTPRPSTQQPDAPLGDDRTGLRLLYPDASDLTHAGSIAGRVLPANPIFASGHSAERQWNLRRAGGRGGLRKWRSHRRNDRRLELLRRRPTNFDGGYQIQKLPIGRSYTVYAEPLDGAVSPSQIANAMQTLCRNATTDAGWPTQFSCVVPAVNTEFTVRTRPGP